MNEKQPPKESDLGARVSIRLNDPAGGFRDLLGILVTINQVQKKDGSVHTFNPKEIAIWKVVPQETTMRRKK
jgi:hypothetical protein